jgi:hypothetical protein
VRSSILFELHLPNAATWFYFSLFLSVALFFQFTRVFTLRNWDLLALFLFVPGFLIIQEARQQPPPPATAATPDPSPSAPAARADRDRFLGYEWLMAATGYWFARCLFDLTAPKRTLPAPNLVTPALIWFGASLFVCLVAVNFVRPTDPWGPVGRPPGAITAVERGAADVVHQTQVPEASPADVLFWVQRSLAAVCHAAIVAALVLTGARHFQSLAVGAAAGALYLLLPYTAYHIGQVHHVWPAALIAWAVFAYRHPTVSGSLLGLAAGTSFFPVLLAPAWVQFYRHRGAGRFALAFAVAGLGGLAVTLIASALTGPVPGGVWPPFQFADWQPWREPVAESIWTGTNWAYRLPVFTAFAAFVLTTSLWPPVRNLGDLIGVSAAVLLGIQFWYADRGGLYVLWYAPLLVLLVLRPTAAELRPEAPGRWPRWVTWAGRRVGLARADVEIAVAP